MRSEDSEPGNYLIPKLVFFAFGFCTLLICPRFALTAESAPEAEVLTVQAAVAEALQQNANLKNYREKVTEADRNVGLAVAQIFPSITASGTAQNEKDPANVASALFGGQAYNDYSVAITAKQPLWDGGAILGGLGFAKKQRQMNQFDVLANERDVSLQVITDFYGVLYSQRLLDTLNRTRNAIEDSVRTTERFYRNGRSQLTDLLQIQTTLALLLPQIKQAETAILIDASHLNYDLGSQNRRMLKLSSDFQIPPADEIRAKLARPMMRPELEKMSLQLDQFDDTKAITLASSWPQFSAFGQIGRSAFAKSDLFNDYSDTWSVGLQLSIPLFSGLSYYRQKEVLESQDWQLHFQADDLNNQENYSETAAEENFDAAISELKSSEEAFTLADRALKESQKNYRLQTINMLTLVQIEQNYLAASSSFDNAKYQYITTAGALFVARGIPLAGLVAMLK